MRIISKKIAMGLLSGVLSLTHVSEAGAQKAVASTTKHLHSTEVLAQSSKSLKGVAKDTYYASNNLATKPKVSTGVKTSSSSKVKLPVSVTPEIVRFHGVKNVFISPKVPPRGVKLISETSDSRFYQLNNKMISEIFNEEHPESLDTVDLAKTIVQVPKSNAQIDGDLGDLINNSYFHLVGKVTSGRTDEGIPFLSRLDGFFTSGENGKFVDYEQIIYRPSDGSQVYFEHFNTHENSEHYPYSRGIESQTEISASGKLLSKDYLKYTIFDGESTYNERAITPEEFRQELTTYKEPMGDLYSIGTSTATPQKTIKPTQKKTAGTQQQVNYFELLQLQRTMQQGQNALMEQTMRSQDAQTQMWKNYYDHQKTTPTRYVP